MKMSRRLTVLLPFLGWSASSLAAPNKVDVCHRPPGNSTQLQSIVVSQNAVAAHVSNHGDVVGMCDDVCDTICSDGNACTQDCDVSTTTCYETAPLVDCDDSDPTTVDSCEPLVGCINTPIADMDRSSSGADLTVGVEPPNPGNRGFGRRVGMLADVNGDGVAELVVAAPKSDPDGSSTTYRPGVIYLFKSPTVLDGSLVLRDTAETRVIGLGTDSNGGLATFDTIDGIPELAITDAPGGDPLGGLGAILRDFPDGDIFSNTIGDASTSTSTRISGAPDSFFSSRPVFGFWNDDSEPDLILTHNIPNTNKTAQLWPGAVAAGVLSASSATERLELLGQAESSAALVVADLVDLTGDGRDDLVIAPSRQTIDYDYADVLFGGDAQLVGTATYADLLDGVSGTRITGPTGSGFGVDVASAGDVDGDGYADLLVSERGGAWLLFGPVQSGLTSVSSGALSPVHYTGITASASYGNHSYGLGDVDSDSYDDLLHCGIGEAGGAGTCWLTFGAPRASLPTTLAMADVLAAGGVRFTNDDAVADGLGVSATGGDVDGDGHRDVVISALPGVFVFAGPFR
ncbi:MAG: VCBS repeat-containing protein [Myxococcales bacterium]|nr:VCBS repeat-containing protein [Myxococcales bacterium]